MLFYFTSTFYLNFVLLILLPALFIENSLNKQYDYHKFFYAMKLWVSAKLNSRSLFTGNWVRHITSVFATHNNSARVLGWARRCCCCHLRGETVRVSVAAAHQPCMTPDPDMRAVFDNVLWQWVCTIQGEGSHSRTPLLTHNCLFLEESIYKCLHSPIYFFTSSHTKDILHNYPYSRWIQVAYLKYTIRSIV